ncbi:hypothetical protein Hanom_Chr09g00871011 [Helianthus anomalus]
MTGFKSKVIVMAYKFKSKLCSSFPEDEPPGDWYGALTLALSFLLARNLCNDALLAIGKSESFAC